MKKYAFAMFLFDYEFVLKHDQTSLMGFEAEELCELMAEHVKDVFFFDCDLFVRKQT